MNLNRQLDQLWSLNYPLKPLELSDKTTLKRLFPREEKKGMNQMTRLTFQSLSQANDLLNSLLDPNWETRMDLYAILCHPVLSLLEKE